LLVVSSYGVQAIVTQLWFFVKMSLAQATAVPSSWLWHLRWLFRPSPTKFHLCRQITTCRQLHNNSFSFLYFSATRFSSCGIAPAIAIFINQSKGGMEKSASKKRTKTSSASESPIKSKGDTDKQIKKKTKKNDDDDMEVMIEAVRTASNPKKNKRAPTEWEKSFNSLAKPKTNFCDNCGCLLPLTADSQINCKYARPIA
jgi:hypothetical protein